MQAVLKKEIAYDLSRFDNRHLVREQVARETRAAEGKTKSKKCVKTKKCMSGFAIVSCVLCMGLVLATMFSYVALTETSDKAGKLKNELAGLQEQTQMLEIQKSQKFGSSQIRATAVEKYGMQKIDKSQITYINTAQTNRAVVMDDGGFHPGDSKLLAGIASGFKTFVEYIN